MSNALIRAAHQVRGLTPGERLVLVALADDARDHNGGRSCLTAREIEARTELTDRSIRRILTRLAAAGHITREAGPAGAAVVTLVHPGRAMSVPAAHGRPGLTSPLPPDSRVRPPRTQESAPLIIETIPVTSLPGARAPEADFSSHDQPAAPAPAGVAGDPVALVFDAWDAMRDRAGLPGPVQRDIARRVAVRARLDAVGLDKVLALIDTVGRSELVRGVKRRGQDDWRVTFDQVFEVGHAAGLRMFTRLLDGEWGAIAAKPGEPHAAANGGTMAPPDPSEPPEIAHLRRLIHTKVTRAEFQNWIAPLRFERDPAGVLRVFAPSAFAADWVRAHFETAIAAAARLVWPSCDAVLFGVQKVAASGVALSPRIEA